jgi:eukaryotic-like serine/threonine-protein kinase
MVTESRVRHVGRRILLVLALLATYGVFTMAAMRVALRARETAVPAFIGLDVAAAVAAGDDAGLGVKVDPANRYDPKIPAGAVAAQDPPAKAPVRRGRTVRVWISAGSRDMFVPRVIGEPQRAAQSQLQQEGLEVASLTEIRSRDLPADTVVAQDPPPAGRGGRVALLINRGERAGGFVMPDVIGVSGEAALDVLRAAGLRVTIVAQQPYPGVPTGTVLRQYPAAGFQITAEEPISLEVSR